MNSIPKHLSKTKLMRGYRCLKSIYLTLHYPHFEAPITPELQALFDQGNQVGLAAQKYFPGGRAVENLPWDFSGALLNTKKLIADKTAIIYEAAFEYQGCYARADILQYSPNTERWRIYEVKSTTKVKPEHLDDIGLQTWIIAKSGLPIEQINLLHLNPECRYPELSHLFKQYDVTQEMRERYLDIRPKITEIQRTVQMPNIPDIDIGPQCQQGSVCGFAAHCWKEKNIPPVSILNLPGLQERKWELYHQGIVRLDDERLNNLSTIQERMVEVQRSGKRYVNTQQIKSALADWQFPLIFLDFETINPAIPRFKGCAPFTQVPFQFSVHILRAFEEELIHHEFLYDALDDPRPSLIPKLLSACEEDGSIVAYFGRFESERIADLATFSPQHAQALSALRARIVDPLPILRESVYDKNFAGSFSLKKVGPALLGDQYSYKDLLVAEGGAAQRAYHEFVAAETSPERKKILQEALLQYCEKDTLVMVELVKWLFAQINFCVEPA